MLRDGAEQTLFVVGDYVGDELVQVTHLEVRNVETPDVVRIQGVHNVRDHAMALGSSEKFGGEAFCKLLNVLVPGD